MRRLTHALFTHTHRRARLLHHDSSGAIMLAALAGIILLLLVSLTLYDTGNKARDKVRLQTAADTAAYGQAAVKARAMNMNAYANVAKRSILGIYQTYHSALSLYATLMLYGVRQSWGNTDGLNINGQNVYPETDVLVQSGAVSSAFLELKLDWRGISVPAMGGESTAGRCCKRSYAIPASILRGPGSTFIPRDRAIAVTGFNRQSDKKVQGAIKKYEKELQQITRYQEYMQKMTPWWGFVEASSRAVNNGATMAVSFPPPDPALLDPGRLPARVGQIKANFASRSTTGLKDWVIASQSLGRDVSLAQSWRRPWDSGEDSDAHQACKPLMMANAGGFADQEFDDEMLFNINTLRSRTPGAVAQTFTDSVTLPNSSNGDPRINKFTPFGVPRAAILSGYSLCAGTMLGLFVSTRTGEYYAPTHFQSPNRYEAALNSYYAAPYHLMINTGPDATHLDRMALSTIVFAYKEGSEWVRGQERMKFTPQSYDLNGSTHESALGTALWTMARSEIVTHGPLSQSHLARSGEWHSNWTARLRPVAFDGELDALSEDIPDQPVSFLHAAFHDAMPFFALAEALGFAQPVSTEQLTHDTVYMERALRALDNTSSAGVFK